MAMPDADTYWNRKALAKRLGISERTLERMNLTGDGPPRVRLSARRVAYRESDVRAWSEARTYPHRAAEMAAKVRK